MYSWLVTVLFLASAAYSSRGQGARVPITSYICTQPNRPGSTDTFQCSVSSGLRTCETKEGGSPTLLDGDSALASGSYRWNGSTNPFVVLDIPQGWWVGSVMMTFIASEPALSLSVHSSEHLSNDTDRTMFSIVSKEGTPPVVVNFTNTCGRYLRINMTEDQYFFLTEIEVFGTNDPICTPPSSAGDNPVNPTTSVGSSNDSVTPTYTSDNSTTPGIPPSHDPVGPDSYVLPTATSIVTVLLVVVLTAIFVVVICIVTCRHNTRKSLEMHCLFIHYRSSQRRKSSDVNFMDSHLFVVDQSAEVPLHDANGAVDKSNDGEISDALCNCSALGPSESNHNVVQGAVEEPVAEGDISRPASQTSIHSNEVSSKLTYGKVTWVHPSTLDHPYNSCNKEIAMAASGGGGHYETPPHWQPAEEANDLPPDCSAVGKFPPVGGGSAEGGDLGLLQECHYELCGWHQIGDSTYDLPPDCKLPNEGAATDGRHKVLEDAKATTSSQRGTTQLPVPQAPPSAWATVDNTFEDTVAEAPKKRREPDPTSPTYANVDHPSSSPMLAAAGPSKDISPRKPPGSAQSVGVPQDDHIYSEVDMSRKKSASSRFPQTGLTHSTDGTQIDGSRKEVDRKSIKTDDLDDDFWGIPTQEVAMGNVFEEVDYSKKESQ